MSVDELRGQVQALLLEVSDLKLQLATPGRRVRSDAPRVYTPSANVPILAKLSDVAHLASNPVRRQPHHPALCQKVDLTGELGHMKVQQAPAFVQHEYEVWACAVSYLYDSVEALKVQISAQEIPAQRQPSLAVPVTANEHVLEYMLERRDLLIAKAEFKDQPGVAAAVGLALDGPSSTALRSERVQELVSQAHTMQLSAMVASAAKPKTGQGAPKGGAPKQQKE